MTDKSLLSSASDTDSVFRNLSVRQKIAIGFGGIILLMTVSIGFTLVKLSDVANITHSVIEERQPTANLFQKLNQDLNRTTSLLEGYLLTGEVELRQKYNLMEKDVLQRLEEAQTLAKNPATGLNPQQLEHTKELFEHVTAYAKKLYELHDSNSNNRGLLLAEQTLNPPAAAFLSTVNTLLAADDFKTSDPQKLKIYKQIQELRYSWVQMMNNMRIYLIVQNDKQRANFDIYYTYAGELLDKLIAMDVDIGFGELDELVASRKDYADHLQAVFDTFASDSWRADAFLIKTELRPILKELQDTFENIANEQLHKAKEGGALLTKANEQIHFSTIIILAIALQVGVLLAIRISGDIVPPIQQLMAAAESIAQGDLNAEVMVTSKDEIGQLGQSFNAMINDLRAASLKELHILNELQDLNEELESRVEDRTKDLEQSEAKIRAILDNIGEGIIVLDEQGKIESLNPAAEVIFNLKEKNAIGIDSAKLIENNDISDIRKMYDHDIECVMSDIDKQPKEYRGIRSDGSTFPMELVVSSMNIGSKRMGVCIVRDITSRKETEASLADAQGQLVDAAHKSGMAEMATGVLHNIGNILNSVNLAGEEIVRISSASKIAGLLKANDMLLQHRDDIGEFLSQDPRGQKLPDYFIKMGKVLSDEIASIQNESKSLIEKTTMMKEVISTQQAYARSGFHVEQLNLPELVEDALKIQDSSLKKWGVKLHKHYTETPLASGQKSKLLQVITNLIKNAKEAMNDNDQFNKPKELIIETGQLNDTAIYLKVKDNGCGIDETQLTKIFNHGFTTKKEGHGFGLHTCANAMTEMKGALNVESDGVQKGACFTVTLPIGKAA